VGSKVPGDKFIFSVTINFGWSFHLQHFVGFVSGYHVTISHQQEKKFIRGAKLNKVELQ
jgi:hypothetical protein